MNFPDIKNCKIAVIGLGYVGLPLAIEFIREERFSNSLNQNRRIVIGFDIDSKRIEELKNGFESTNEIKKSDLYLLNKIKLTSSVNELREVNVFIVTVPTPIDKFKNPDTSALRNASKMIGEVIKGADKSNKIFPPIIIFESTVYPGATEEICIPIIEKHSNLSLNKDFFCGYSPERINPGDKLHGLREIVKVTSGSDRESTDWIDKFYGSIIDKGTHKVKSIKIAEAAKIIENTQRDLNIALINELSIICSLLNIDTLEVLEAASTKWNFLPFKPGLVGGHCIGVDPYYLTHKAQALGYHPEVILAGRKINDNMPKWIAQRVVLELVKKGHKILTSNILIMGYSFKENCPDFRNTKVNDLAIELREYGITVLVQDPLCNIEKVMQENNIKIVRDVQENQKFDCVIMAVAHKEYTNYKDEKWSSLLTARGLIFDLKGFVPRILNPIRL